MQDKTFKQLKTIFTACMGIVILVFIFDVLYTTKYVTPIENVALERWSIIITLGGIFASLRLLHPKLKEQEKVSPEIARKKYTSKYYIRLAALIAVYGMNITCLYFTGVKNFMFLAFITIFALFLCAPNKQHMMNETKVPED